MSRPPNRLRSIWIVLKLQALEVIVFALVLSALAAASFIIEARLRSIGVSLDTCVDPVGCDALRGDEAFFSSLIPVVSLTTVAVAAFGGLFLGVPAAAAEIERGTAMLTWSMSPVREAWFLRRIVVVAVVLAFGTILPVIATDRMFASAYPDVDISRSFEGFEIRGPVILARAMAGFGVGALGGAIAGRQLSGLLLALFGTALLLGGVQGLNDTWMRSEATLLQAGTSSIHALVYDVNYVLPDGTLANLGAAMGTLDGTGKHPADVYPARYVGLAGDVAPEERAREFALTLGAGIICVGLAAGVVRRRRPY